MNSVSISAVIKRSPAPLPGLLERALRELRKAYHCALELGHPPWEFAVTIGELRRLGLTETDLRWLVRTGHVEHRVEVTQPEHAQRRFGQSANLSLTERSCFVLTAVGLACAGRVPPAAGGEPETAPATPAGEVPRWDEEEHTLYWRGRVVKCFREDAPCQEAILSTFQAADWAGCVEVNLPRDGGTDAKQRLRDAVRNLNRGVRPYLRFRQEGCGSRVRWEAAD
jgi:hypothetical protein